MARCSVFRVLVRSTRGPGFEFRLGHVGSYSPVTFGGSVWVRAWDASSKWTVSLVSGMVPSRFGDESVNAGGNCHRPTVWPDRSVVTSTRTVCGGPGFEFRSGHVLFPSL